MSFGALSPNAVRALSRGAKMAGCYMSTGEGSLSPYHVEGDCDILYQIGPAKFGCRTPDGRFDDEKAAAILALPQVKMVEIKLAQGAKPGKGGVLPKEKITKEIAAIRGIPMGQDCHSPNRFEEFDDAPSLLDFVERVRKLTGKPIGLKMVVGQPPRSASSVARCAGAATDPTSSPWMARKAGRARLLWRWPTTSGCP